MFIISEIFPQHSGDITMAKRMIHLSRLAGASAIKLQLLQNNMFSKDNLDRSYNELSFENFKLLVNYSKDIGIDVFATAFTEETLDWCVKLDLNYLKIPARMHQENPNLVSKIIKLNKKTFISIRPEEKKDIKIDKKENLFFLSCISKYPTLLSNVSLPDFKKSDFDGISDHSLGISVALKACSLGAKYLEKHFTFNKNLQKETEKGHLGAMDFDDLKLLKKLTMEIEEIGKTAKKII
jgi:sialic acid synthase SpsE